MDRYGQRGGGVSYPGLSSGAILSLDQIRAIRSRNEYTGAPSVPPRNSENQERTHEVMLVSFNNNRKRPGSNTRPPALSRSISAASSGSNSSVSSEQGLLARSPPGFRAEQAVRSQPKSLSSSLHPFLSPNVSLKQAQLEKVDSAHLYVCENCGKCKCAECRMPRPLPSRLACDGQFVCSADNLVEHGTCMCLVKGMFYHCSNEDDVGDPCTDQPCSLSHPHCCSRFMCMGLVSVLFPCLLCYLPAKSCVKACHSCHDHVNRPGCRCKNSNTVYCKLQSWHHPSGHMPAKLRS